MKAKVKREELLKSLKISSSALLTNDTSNLLFSSFKLDFEDGKGKVTSIGRRMGIRSYFPGVSVDEPFGCLVNAQMLLGAVSKMGTETITIELVGNGEVLLKGGRAKIVLGNVDDTFYAPMKSAEDGETLDIDTKRLKNYIAQSSHSLAPANAGNYLMESFFVQTKEHFSVTAIDGHRISFRGDYKNASYSPKDGYLLQGDLTKKIAGLLPEEYTVKAEGDIITFIGSDLIIDLVQNNGAYFNCSNFTNLEPQLQAEFEKDDLLEALDVIMVVVDKSSHSPVIMTIDDGVIRLNYAQQAGQADGECPAVVTGDVPLTFGINPQFLKEALKSIDGDRLVLSAINKTSPIFLKGEDYQELILPVRITA